jgi:hypothetical protein
MNIPIVVLTASLMTAGAGLSVAQPAPHAATTSIAVDEHGSLEAIQPPPAQPRTPTAGRGVPGKPPTTPEPPGTAPEARAPAPPSLLRPAGQPINVKVELTITDQRGGAAPVKKTVAVVTGDGLSGFIRSQSQVSGVGAVPLNVDVEPLVLPDGKIRLRVNLQYDLPAPTDAMKENSPGTTLKTEVHDSVSLILESGKAMIAAQSADPVTDRQVTVDVKATILR